MNFAWEPEYAQFREEVRAFTREWGPKLAAEGWQGPEGNSKSPTMKLINDELERKGWIRRSWAKELGGEGMSPWYLAILVEELNYGGIPMTSLTISSIAPAIVNHGTEDQKKKYLPGIMSRELEFCIGYSEPNAGTDLASLETRAIRDGDDYVINGQKIWTSNAQNATHIWLAARTDPNAPKHRGISMFIVPMGTPGISVRAIPMAAGGRTNEVFFEDVRVSKDTMVGEEGRGWYTTANALDYERVALSPVGSAARTFDNTLKDIKEQLPAVLKDPAKRRRIAELNMHVHVLRALKMKSDAIIANGYTPNQEASEAKVWATELIQYQTEVWMELMGRYGVQDRESAAKVHDGAVAGNFMGSPVLRFGGGTNEVQRNIIAQRGLGLPR